MWVMMHFFILCSSALRKKIFINAIVLNLMIMAFILISFIFIREPRLSGTSAKSIEGRFGIWNAGFTAMEKKSQILSGLGLGGYEDATIFPHAHNLYLSFFFDFGIIGFFCIIMIMLVLFKEYVLKRSRMIFLSQNNYYEIMSLAFFSGLLALGLHGIMEYSYLHTIVWLFLGFVMSTLQLSRLEK